MVMLKRWSVMINSKNMYTNKENKMKKSKRVKYTVTAITLLEKLLQEIVDLSGGHHPRASFELARFSKI